MRRGLRILLWSLAGLFVLAIGTGAVVADAYLQAYHTYKNDLANIVPQLDQARQELSQGLLPSADPFDAAASEAEQAQADVAHARFTYRLTSHIPFFSRPIEAVNLGVDAANNEAQAAITMRDMVQGLLGPEALRGGDTFSGNPPVFTNGVVNVKLIQGLSPQLDGLVAHLQAADRDIRAIRLFQDTSGWTPHYTGSGVDVARHGDVDDGERAVAAPLLHGRDLRGAEHSRRAVGARDEQVDLRSHRHRVGDRHRPVGQGARQRHR